MQKNIFLIVNSLLFAVLFWTAVTLNYVYSIDISIPLNVTLKESQALSEDLPAEIDITAKGRGWELLNLWFSKNLSYNLDLTGVKRNLKLSILQSINDKIELPQNVYIVSSNPDTLNIDFDNTTSRYVKVRNNLRIVLKDGYEIVGSPKIIPDSVKVTGSVSVLSRIKFIPTESNVIKNVNSDLSLDVKLSDSLSKLIKIEPAQVKINYKVELAAERKFDDVSVTVKNLPEGMDVLLIPPNVNLSLRGGVDLLSKINATDIKIFVDYSQLDRDTLGFVSPTIEVPDNLTVLEYQPQKFQYIIKKKNQ